MPQRNPASGEEYNNSCSSGDLDRARVLSDECLEISKESGDWLGVANTLDQLYRIEYWKSNYVEAYG
jgi:hypothetical protein